MCDVPRITTQQLNNSTSQPLNPSTHQQKNMIFPTLNKNIIIAVLLALFTIAAIYTGTLIGSNAHDIELQQLQIKYDSEHQAVLLISDNHIQYVQEHQNTISKDDFKEMFASEFQTFAKSLKLKNIEHFTDVKTITEHHIQTTLKDSIISDTAHVNSFEYTSANLTFKGYTSNDSLIANYKYRLQLQIATGKQQRKGFWNKITLQPFNRIPIVQAISTDSNTIITNIKSITIK